MSLHASVETRSITYDDGVVRGFTVAALAWGLIGLLVGLLAALQLSFPALNFDLPWLTFSRIRPLHTNAVIFALVGNSMFAGIYWSTQRLLKARMASDLLSRIHLWGWQLILVGAAITLPLGITQSKEYAELEWFLDLPVAIVWVLFGVNFFCTLKRRNEKNLYVAIWFYIATIVTVAVLYVVNNLALPISGTKSYGVFAGAQDALTQWWYGHNAVAFFLTTPILGLMYYFLPKAAERPVYSYRLSIVHFWALVFLYIWAGPHHLLYTALPSWAQSLGMIFSLMLWAPSWGGMLNGLLTLRGAWHKVRTDPVLKFFVAAVTFYGMATFEGPLMSIKSVNALSHYTDWTIGHVHGGALGWNGFMAAGVFYWLVPRLWNRPLHSRAAADWHFWIATFGILLYIVAMWISGITQGLMWRAETADGGLLYQWIEVVAKTKILYGMRALGGAAYIAGWVLMIWNCWRTARAGQPVDGRTEVTVLREPPAIATATATSRTPRLVLSQPVVLVVVGLVLMLVIGLGDLSLAVVGLVLLAGLVVWAAFVIRAAGAERPSWHQLLEGRPFAFTVLVVFAALVGGLVELLPGIVVRQHVPLTADGKPAATIYTACELEGRDVYVGEGCYGCHSQMIRPFRAEFLRYGEPSRLEESMFDRPFQWGSKRTGPDLAREGVLRPDAAWHWHHLLDPRQITPGSNMPGYPWLADERVDLDFTASKLRAMQRLGVPYGDDEVQGARDAYLRQAGNVVQQLQKQGIEAAADSKLVALIAYLQRLGRTPETQVGQAAAGADAAAAASSGAGATIDTRR